MTTPITQILFPSFRNLNYGMLIKWTIDDEVVGMSNMFKPITYGGVDYDALAFLLNVSDTTTEIQNSSGDIVISISGLPNEPDPMGIVLGSNVKGSKVEIRLVLLDSVSDTIMTSTKSYYDANTEETTITTEENVYLRWKGYVTGYSITEDVQQWSKDRTNMITLNCASHNKILENKYSGRRTLDSDWRRTSATDPSMSRVEVITRTAFNFGKDN